MGWINAGFSDRPRGRDDGNLCPNCADRYWGQAGHCAPCCALIRTSDWTRYEARTCEATRRKNEKCSECGWAFRKDGHAWGCANK